MKSTVCCFHWTLLLVFILSCSCLLALVVSCEGTSESIEGPITGITTPIHPPSALPKTTHLVSSTNSPDVLDEKTTDVKQIFLNASSSEIKSEVGSTVSTSDNERGGNFVYSDAVQIQPEGIKNDPVAEIHSSFEESLIETKSCVELSQKPDENLKSKSDCTKRLNSDSGPGFTETKDARIIDPVVELGKVLEDKANAKKHANDKVAAQLDSPFDSNNNLTAQSSIEVKESPCSGADCVMVSQTLASSKNKDSESATKVATPELTSQKESGAYIVTAEPKVVESKKTDATVETPEVRSKPEAEEKVLKEEKNGVETVVSKPSSDTTQDDEKIKVEGQSPDAGKAKENLDLVIDNPSAATGGSLGSLSTPEPPTTPSSPSASEDMPSFSEWTQKRLEEAERRKVQNDTSGQGGSDGSGAASSHGSSTTGGSSNGVTGSGASASGASSTSGSSSSGSAGDSNVGTGGSVSGGSKVRQKNYASPDCGAKIAAANPEAVSPGSVLSPSRDEYLLNACSSRSWFVVELCEAIRAKKIELANFELFSSSPKEFSIWISDRFPTRDWSLVGRFTAKDERTLQSFHLDLHIFTKFMRVEMHSHYGSEHFCPVSLFRVYGTSEFEVLETEQDDGEDGVGRSGDSSGSLIGEDDGEDSDVEESLDVETGGPPRNLFGSARDAVMSIVKKAAEALVKAGDSANETITLATESPIKEDPKTEAPEPSFDGEEAESSLAKNRDGASECKSLRHPPVCHGCEEAVILRAAALLSCHYDTLRPLSSSPFVRSALASGGLCMTRFGLPLSAPNHSSSTTATDAGYISALLPTEYLVALCNALITPDMIRDTEPATPEPPASEVPNVIENQTASVTLESQRTIEGTLKGGTSSTMVASMIKPTRTLKGDEFESEGPGESMHDSGGHEEISQGVVMSSPVVESPQSTYMPGFTHFSGSGSIHQEVVEGLGLEEGTNADIDGSTSLLKQDPPESAGEPLEKYSESNIQEVSESESTTVVLSVIEPAGGVIVSSATSVPSPSAIPPSQSSSSSSAPPVQPPQQTGDGLPSQGSQPSGSKGSDGAIPVPNLPPATQSPHIQTGTGSGNAKGQETGNSGPPPLPNTAVAQKESVFVRLSNRIKTLERNMSLSAQYLEELSRRYRKQFEEAQKQAVEAQKRDKRLAEDAANLQARLDILAEAVKGLLDARKREEEQRMKEKEEEEAKLREEQEYGRHFPWWASILIWLWSTTGKIAVSVAQHAVIFCVELVVLWALMGQYQRRRWGWSAVPTAPIETEVQQNLEEDAQSQLKYGSLRKRRKWTKEEDWTEATEMGRSPRKRRPTLDDVEASSIAETVAELVVLDASTGQQQHKQRRRRRKLKSSSTASLSSFPLSLLPPSSDSPFPPPYSATESFSVPPVENLNGWTWPCHGSESVQRATILEDGFKMPEISKDDKPCKGGSGDKMSPNVVTDRVSKDGFGKSKSRRVSAPIYLPEDNEKLTKSSAATSPLSRSSSQIHNSLRICSPKLKADNWEWFTGARISGDSASKGSRAANSKNNNSALPLGDGLGSPETAGASGRTSGTSSPTPSSSSSKSKDKKSGSGNSSGGGSSFKRIVKRFF